MHFCSAHRDQNSTWCHSSETCPPCFWRQTLVSTWVSPNRQDWLSSKPQGSTCLYLPRAEITSTHTQASTWFFYMVLGVRCLCSNHLIDLATIFTFFPSRDGKMAHQLRLYIEVTEDLHLIPITHIKKLTTFWKGLWLPQTPTLTCTHTPTQAHNLKQNRVNFKWIL